MIISRKTKKIIKVEARQIRDGECFYPDCYPDDLYFKINGRYSGDDHYLISATRLRDGLENRFKATTIVQPVGATVNMEE